MLYWNDMEHLVLGVVVIMAQVVSTIILFRKRQKAFLVATSKAEPNTDELYQG